MIIDCEVHIGQFKGDPYTWLEEPVGVPQLLRIMDQYRIDRAIVMAPTEQFPKNEEIAASLRNQARLLGFAVVNPYGEGAGVPELRNAITKWGMSGLKLMPLRHAYEIDGETAVPIMKAAAEFGIPVSIHSGSQFCLLGAKVFQCAGDHGPHGVALLCRWCDQCCQRSTQHLSRNRARRDARLYPDGRRQSWPRAGDLRIGLSDRASEFDDGEYRCRKPQARRQRTRHGRQPGEDSEIELNLVLPALGSS
jgi:hypothetical protein